MNSALRLRTDSFAIRQTQNRPVPEAAAGADDVIESFVSPAVFPIQVEGFVTGVTETAKILREICERATHNQDCSESDNEEPEP
jgi:hypothetical protein